ncbi:MAG: zf-HC2 domain-containing protein [Actinomycetota bacterium]|nr:zf-HC2 domain-containing protein [Actinomycetota bacterium]
MRPHDMIDMFRRKGGARCVEVGRKIQTYLDGGLDPDTAAKVSRHLHACRRCGLAADDFRRLKSALAETSAPMSAEPLRRLQALAADLAAGDNAT